MLNEREYFEKYIRPHNKVLFNSGRKLDTSSYIPYESNKKDDFKERVQKYMREVEKEESGMKDTADQIGTHLPEIGN